MFPQKLFTILGNWGLGSVLTMNSYRFRLDVLYEQQDSCHEELPNGNCLTCKTPHRLCGSNVTVYTTVPYILCPVLKISKTLTKQLFMADLNIEVM